jgi:hypothetical protein
MPSNRNIRHAFRSVESNGSICKWGRIDKNYGIFWHELGDSSVYVADRLEAVKWRNWKVVFYDEQRDWWTPHSKLGSPKAFDLITDPKEEYPATALRNSWNAGPAMKIVTEFERSLKLSTDRARDSRPVHSAKIDFP